MEDCRTVVVVEDDDLIRLLLETVLGDEGYRTVGLTNGVKTVETVKASKASLVITDLAMPGCNGLTVVEAMRADPETRDVPIVVVSAHTSWLDHRNPPLVQGVLSKPFDLDELMSLVNGLVCPAA